MLNGLFGDILLRQVPEHLMAGVHGGQFRVYGSIVRSVTNGQIAGHLQETSGLANAVASMLGGPATLPLQGAGMAVDLVGHTVSYVQNEQIKAAIAVVQNLQIAGLALGAIGIGVSVAGFAVLSKKIERVEGKIDAMAGRLDVIARSIEALRQDRINEDFVRLRTASERMDEGWQLADPEPQWRDVAGEMHRLQHAFAHRATELLEAGAANAGDAEPFVDAVSLASTIRVAARLAAGDEVVARRAAEEGAVTLNNLGQHYRAPEAAFAAVRATGAKAGTREWGEALERAADDARNTVGAMRAREAASTAAVATLQELDRRQIRGRSWMEAAREAKEAILFLPASTASA